MKNIKIKLLRIVSKAENGMYQRAIIVWDRWPYMAYIRRVSVDEQIAFGRNEVEEVVTQYKYFILINLYFIEIDFNWLWPLKENEL